MNQRRSPKSQIWIAATCLICTFLLTAHSATGQKSLFSTIDIYGFPTEGQDSSQQSMDQADCYSWAVENTGVDPFELAKEAEAIQQQGQAQASAEIEQQTRQGLAATEENAENFRKAFSVCLEAKYYMVCYRSDSRLEVPESTLAFCWRNFSF